MAPERTTPSSDFAKVLRELAPYLGLGATLAATVGVFVATGYWLDGKLETSPLLALGGGLLGVVVALVQFVRVASKLRQKSSPNPKPPVP